MTCYFLSSIYLASAVSAWPWIANVPGVDLSAIHNHPENFAKQHRQTGSLDPTCPFNADHPGAAPFDVRFPYTGSINGLPGTGIGGVQVPAPGDTAHEFTPPGPNDIRGPCPGMNTAANHNFLSHDGITDLAELVSAQQNLYNLAYDLAVFIAVRGIALDGDVVTTKLSIGCDATERTSIDPTGTLGREPGLNAHNKFEGDTSLTRRDYFLNNGDAFTFQGDMFADMYRVANGTSNGLFDRDTIAVYRSQRYDESLAENPNFYFGPKALLLYGAASFIYEVFPIFGPEGDANIDMISTFYGAVPNSAGSYDHVPERIPENWSNRRTAYGLLEIGEEIRYQFSYAPKLFGGNVGAGNFLALNTTFGIIENGTIPGDATAADFTCLLYQLATDNVPGTVGNEAALPLDVLAWVLTQLNPVFGNLGCPLKLS
ncbi:Cloroperoxidase [Paraphaeosphaeria sporulosa]|uniref:Cloroperoxidase n=1 Tax=Paraphaeosphaeria sporulosa TaxID=1460663 RepID=A0A177D0A5_9PLEO|nr:Cloroperoxidase [Paraphaeosphaeria sporulosa]OAG12657.1 Cloroperoxidase [Paraphaeosphaeria sporulosa]